MSSKFFGQFLLERGKIIKEELLDAIEFQKSVNVKLGTIAIDAGYLTAEQVAEIHQEQMRTDKLFGEIALEKNYLTEEQLEELLLIQKNERISLGDALVQKGYLSMQDLESELKAYREEELQIKEKELKIFKELKSPVIPKTFLDITKKLFLRIVGVEIAEIKFHKNKDNITPYFWNISQNFFGDSEGVYLLSLKEDLFLKIASAMNQEKLIEVDNYAKDGVKEFVNTIVGNSASKLSQDGIKIDLKPPILLESPTSINFPSGNYEIISINLTGLASYLQLTIIYLPLFV